MLRSLRSAFLSTVSFAPDTGGAAGDTPEDERIEVELDDDEAPGDPVDDAPADDPADEANDAASDDDAEPADDEDEPAIAARPERPLSRAERRVTALSERTRLQAEENARLTRELDTLRRAAPAQAVESPQQRADRFALLTPEERIREEVNESLARHDQRTGALHAQLLDQGDRTSFEAMQAVNPLAKRYASRIEAELTSLRARGQNLPRKDILTYIVGQQVLAQQGKSKPKAQERQRAQQARPVRAGGDVASDRRGRRDNGDLASLERRLENQQI